MMKSWIDSGPFSRNHPSIRFSPGAAAGAESSTVALRELTRSHASPRRKAGTHVVLDGTRVELRGEAPHAGTAPQEGVGAQLSSILHDLCEPFRSPRGYALELAEIQTRVAPPDSGERAVARRLVQFAYGSRYLGSSEVGVDGLDNDHLERIGEAATVVAVARQGDAPHVMACVRFIVGERLCMYDFFSPAAGQAWPHGLAVATEYTRLAFHPIFDAMGTACDETRRELVRFYRLLMVRKLAASCTELSSRRGAKLRYLIAAPHVARFLSGCGIPLEPVTRAVPVESELSSGVRKAFARYWRDGQSARRPAVVLLSAELDTVIARFGPHRVAITPSNSIRICTNGTFEPALDIH